MITGILTMHRVNNLGSLLQSYALKQILSELGSDVVFLDIEKRSSDNKLVSGAMYDYKWESDTGKKIDKFFTNRLNNKIRCYAQNVEYEKFRRRELNIIGANIKTELDACVIGSDEVFNCLSPSPWGFTSQLFGNVSNVEKVFTYAASCGATREYDLPEEAKGVVQNAFGKLKGISVRDSNTKRFAEILGKKTPVKHLDPVLVYDFKEEAGGYRKLGNKMPKNYCILYSYQNRIHRQSEIEKIKRFANENNYKLVSIGQAQYWLPHHKVVHPFEAINVFKGAEYVITDTYHGCILAAKYAKDFSVLARDSNENKIKDLVKTLGLQDYLMSSMDELKVHKTASKKNINIIIEREKERTKEYLYDMLYKQDI